MKVLVLHRQFFFNFFLKFSKIALSIKQKRFYQKNLYNQKKVLNNKVNSIKYRGDDAYLIIEDNRVTASEVKASISSNEFSIKPKNEGWKNRNQTSVNGLPTHLLE